MTDDTLKVGKTTIREEWHETEVNGRRYRILIYVSWDEDGPPTHVWVGLRDEWWAEERRSGEDQRKGERRVYSRYTYPYHDQWSIGLMRRQRERRRGERRKG